MYNFTQCFHHNYQPKQQHVFASAVGIRTLCPLLCWMLNAECWKQCFLWNYCFSTVFDFNSFEISYCCPVAESWIFFPWSFLITWDRSCCHPWGWIVNMSWFLCIFSVLLCIFVFVRLYTLKFPFVSLTCKSKAYIGSTPEFVQLCLLWY